MNRQPFPPSPATQPKRKSPSSRSALPTCRSSSRLVAACHHRRTHDICPLAVNATIRFHPSHVALKLLYGAAGCGIVVMFPAASYCGTTHELRYGFTVPKGAGSANGIGPLCDAGPCRQTISFTWLLTRFCTTSQTPFPSLSCLKPFQLPVGSRDQHWANCSLVTPVSIEFSVPRSILFRRCRPS